MQQAHFFLLRSHVHGAATHRTPVAMSPAELKGERPGSPGVQATHLVDTGGAQGGLSLMAVGWLRALCHSQGAGSPALQPTPTPPTARPAPREKDAVNVPGRGWP